MGLGVFGLRVYSYRVWVIGFWFISWFGAACECKGSIVWVEGFECDIPAFNSLIGFGGIIK